MVPGASTSTKNTYGWCVEVDHHSTPDCFKICERYHRHVQPPPRNLCEHHQCVASFAFPSNNLPALKRINERSRRSSTFYSLIGHGLVPLSKHTLWIATIYVCFLPVSFTSLLLGASHFPGLYQAILFTTCPDLSSMPSILLPLSQALNIAPESPNFCIHT